MPERKKKAAHEGIKVAERIVPVPTSISPEAQTRGARGESSIEALKDEITAAGGEAVAKVADVRRRGDLEALVATATERLGRLDVMVNNAGIGPISRLYALRVEEWDAMIDVDLRGTLYGIAAVLPVFARQDCGHLGQCDLDRRHRDRANDGGLCGYEERDAGHDRGAAAGSRPQPAGDRGVSRDDLHQFRDSITDEPMKRMISEREEKIAIPPEAIARGIFYAIEQPSNVEVGSVVRPTAQD